MMRVLCEIMLDKNPDSPMADEDMLTQAAHEFLPAPGQVLRIPGDEGEAAYTVTSTNAWHEEASTSNGSGQHQMTGTDTHRGYRTVSDR